MDLCGSASPIVLPLFMLQEKIEDLTRTLASVSSSQLIHIGANLLKLDAHVLESLLLSLFFCLGEFSRRDDVVLRSDFMTFLQFSTTTVLLLLTFLIMILKIVVEILVCCIIIIIIKVSFLNLVSLWRLSKCYLWI